MADLKAVVPGQELLERLSSPRLERLSSPRLERLSSPEIASPGRNTIITKDPVKKGLKSRTARQKLASNQSQASDDSRPRNGSRRTVSGGVFSPICSPIGSPKPSRPGSPVAASCESPGRRSGSKRANIMSGLSVVDDHPFFKGTSEAFRQEIIPHLARRRFGDGGSENRLSTEIIGFDRQGVFGNNAGVFDMRDTSVVRTLVSQCEDPTEEFDGLLMTDGRFDADLELIYNNLTVGILRSNAVVGVERLFGVSEKPLFGVRLRMEPTCAAFFVPRAPLLAALSDPAFAADRDLLYHRVHEAAVATLSKWCSQNSAKVKIKLFSHVNPTFKNRYLQAVTMRVCKAGTAILKEGDTASSCIFVYHGEAKVLVPGTNGILYTLAHMGQGSTTANAASWAGWWSLLEATGACPRRPSGVEAVTDCVVWHLESSALNELREDFPTECKFLDKVAVKHMKLLSQYAMDFFQVPMLKECEPNFLAQLECVCTHRILLPGEYVVKEGETGTEMFLLARGQATVWRGDVKLVRQGEGACFGELAVLGIAETRTASIICETVCDLRVLDRDNLLKALTHFPKESDRLGRVAEAHGYSRKLAIKELRNLQSFKGFSDKFIQQLSEHMHEHSFFLGQMLAKQDEESFEMFVVTGGTLALEVSGTQCAKVVAPAVMCEAALLNPGSKAQATIRCLTVCDCFAINTKLIAEQFQSTFPEDMKKLEELYEARRIEMADGLLSKFDADPENGEDGSDGTSSLMKGMSGTFFSSSDSAFLEQLSLQLEKRIFFDGQVMLREGDAGDFALLMKDGTGVVEAGGVRVAEIKRGDFVGEVVLLGFAEAYSCTIRASGLVTAFSVNKEKFREVIDNFPDEQKRLEALMHRRVSLTRNLTKLNQFSKSMPSGKGDHEGRHGSLTSNGTRRFSQSVRRSTTFLNKGRATSQSVTASSVLSRSSMTVAPRDNILSRSTQERHTLETPAMNGRNASFDGASRSSRASNQLMPGRRRSNEDSFMKHHLALSSRSSLKSETGGGSFRRGSSSSVRASRCSMMSVMSELHLPENRVDEKADGEEDDDASEKSELESHPDSDSEGYQEWERERRLRQSGPVQLKLWVSKRKKAMKKADWRRNRSLKAEYLPSPNNSAEQPLIELKQGGAEPTRPQRPSKLKKVNSVYGRPVWHEVYGPPVILPPMPRSARTQ